MDPKQNQNFILAIVLSMLVLVGWQYFYAMPKMREEQARRELLEQAAKKLGQTGQSGQATIGTTPGAQPGGTPAVVTPGAIALPVTMARDQALKGSTRLTIDTPSITGSIALTGARFDDIVFKKYKQTIASDSPNEIFLSPAGSEGAHFVDYGYVTADGQVLAGPGAMWSLASGTTLTEKTPVTLALDAGKGITLRRTIAVDDKYMFTVSDEIENKSGSAVSLQQTVSMFKLGEPKIPPQWYLHEGFIGYAGTQGVLEWTWAKIKEKAQPFDALGGWVGITDKYFATVFIPARDQASKLVFKHLPDGPGVYQADYLQAPVSIATGAKVVNKTELFAGAKEVHTLDKYGSTLNIPKFSYLMDWGWFYFFTQPLFYLIDWIYRQVGNFGIAMLTVTVIVKAAFFPLANRAYTSMARMKKLQPEMAKIQERFKDDKAKQQQATMELYKTEKINPVAGCFPVLLQIPVFFALYKVLFVTIEMRHAPFFGWIHDLSAPDPTNLFNLFGLLPYTVPATVPFLHLGIWPMIMGVTMWLQMQLNPPPPDPTQARIFAWMPVVFTFTLGLFPAGLVIYWAWNNTLTIIQQYVIMRRQGAPVELFDNVMRNFGFATPAQKAAAEMGGSLPVPAAGNGGTGLDADAGEQAQRKRTPKPKRNKGPQGQA